MIETRNNSIVVSYAGSDERSTFGERVVRLLCATDLLPRSDAAIERAGCLADELGAELSLLHVVESTHSESVPEETLQAAAGNLRSRADPSLWRRARAPGVIVRAGRAPRLVVEVARRRKARLLVMGGHRKRGLLEAFDSSIADNALASRVCPVLLVQRAPVTKYSNVVLGLNATASSVAALKTAESLFLHPGVTATVIHAFEPVFRRLSHVAGGVGSAGARFPHIWAIEAEAAIRGMLKLESQSTSRFDVEVAEGKPAAVLLHAAAAMEADLIVVGARAAGILQRALTGSVAKQIMERATCDVLIVPEPLTANYAVHRLSGVLAAASKSAARQERDRADS